MSLLDLSNREMPLGTGLTIYRSAMRPRVANLLGRGAFDVLADFGIDPTIQTKRRSSASPILPAETAFPMLLDMADELGVDMPLGTMKVNLQELGGRQAWHRDYVPEPFIAYPTGRGMLELAPGAGSVEEARAARLRDEVVSVPMYAGDIALLHIGGEVFHRGCNASDAPRVTVVLH